MKNNKIYSIFKFRKIIIFFILFGSINYGTTLFGFDIINYFNRQFNNKVNYNISNIIKFLIFASAIYTIIFNRTIYTPFLDYTVLPSTLIYKEPPADYDFIKTIKTSPNTKILYWASQPHKDKQFVYDAYGDYSNSGVVYSDENGNANLKIKDPSSYEIPTGEILPKHIHYRECKNHILSGMIGPLKTIYL